MSSTTATHSYGVSSFSVIIIAQSDAISIEYVIGRLKNISLEQLLFEERNFSESLSLSWYFFSEAFWKRLVCMLCKSLLISLTFVNCEGLYLTEGFLHNLVSILCLRH